MRTIKFRFYDQREGTGEWKIREVTLDDIEGEDSWQGSTPWRRVATCQFTGLLDRHGKEIYEGDIMKVVALSMEVYWDEEKGSWRLAEYGLGTYEESLTLNKALKYEIIGNIYENPQLLTNTE